MKKKMYMLFIIVILFLTACKANAVSDIDEVTINSETTAEYITHNNGITTEVGIEDMNTSIQETEVESEYITEETTNIGIITEEIETTREYELCSWIGEYRYYEFHEPNMHRGYDVSIYENNNVLYADVSVEGFQVFIITKAVVKGNENRIDIIFEEYYESSLSQGGFKKGDVLLSFVKIENRLITEWETLRPMNIYAERSGEYFYSK